MAKAKLMSLSRYFSCNKCANCQLQRIPPPCCFDFLDICGWGPSLSSRTTTRPSGALEEIVHLDSCSETGDEEDGFKRLCLVCPGCDGRPLRRGRSQHSQGVVHISDDEGRESTRAEFKFCCAIERGQYKLLLTRLSLMFMLTILITSLSMVVWHLNTSYTNDGIKSISLSLRNTILQRPIYRMLDILNTTLSVTVMHCSIATYVIGQKSLRLPSLELHLVMRNVTWSIFESETKVSSLKIVYRDGVTEGYSRNASKDENYVYSVPAAGVTTHGSSHNNDFVLNASSDAFVWYQQQVNNDTGHNEGPPITRAKYDLDQDLAGVALLSAGSVKWHATVHSSDSIPFLSSGSPVVDPNTGNVVAVSGLTLKLTSLNDLIRVMPSVQMYNLTVYVTTREGYLLASSTTSNIVKNGSDGGPASLLMASESTNPIIKTTANWLNRSYGNDLQNVHRENIRLGLRHSLYFVDTVAVGIEMMPLVAVVVTPRNSILGSVDRKSRLTLYILIAVSILILVVGFAFICLLTRGISLAMAMKQIDHHLYARRRAEASSNYKSEFLANMSHELRTPMASVIGLLDLLLTDERMTSEQVEMVSQIRQCSTALLGLLNNILDLSKVESGKIVLEEADFDLQCELEDIVDLFAVQCTHESIEIVLDLADDVPSLVRGDSARTVQVFANVIANSIKFTSTGHVLVRGYCHPPLSAAWSKSVLAEGTSSELQARSRSSSSGFSRTETDVDTRNPDTIRVWFEIDDTGCGIEPSKWESVFESFVQADLSTTRIHGGTGLGLCIVRSLVEKMGGEIKVVKKDDPGTLITFSLTFKLSQSVQSPLSTLREISISTFSSEKLQNSTILFSDQGNTGRMVLSKWLRKNGLDVIETATWESTIAELEQLVEGRPPKLTAVAILDLSMVNDESHLNELDKYVQRGVSIGWLLRHDTSNKEKKSLRKRGFSVVINKPLYKSKLIRLLRVLVGMSKDDYNSFERPLIAGEGPQMSRPLLSYQQSKGKQQIMQSLSLKPNLKRHSFHSLDRISEISSEEELSEHTNSSDSYRRRSEGDFPRKGAPPSSSGAQLEALAPENVLNRLMEPLETRADIPREDFLPGLEEDPRESAPLHQGPPEITGDTDDGQVQRDVAQGRDEHIVEMQTIQPTLDSSTIVRKPTELRASRSSGSSSRPPDVLKGVRILSAEDNKVLQRIASKNLTTLGATVVSVDDGLEAVNAITRSVECTTSTDARQVVRELKYPHPAVHPFDLILMDCQMPKMDGYEATRTIREAEQGTGCHIPIVALTAHAMSSDEAKCLEVGMDAYLTKPMDKSRLISTILSLISTREDF